MPVDIKLAIYKCGYVLYTANITCVIENVYIIGPKIHENADSMRRYCDVTKVLRAAKHT